MRMNWNTQNEATDADGFLLEGEASFAAEMECLRQCGCPETATARFVSVEIVGRTESMMMADVSAAMAEWLYSELDAEEIYAE